MKMMNLLQTWLLITVMALSANGAVNAKVALGGINLSSEAHWGLDVSKPLNALGISDVSATRTISSPLVPNAGGKVDPNDLKGGAHRDTTKPAGDGLDSHHMPDRNADPRVHANDGPAIKMDPEDHHLTSSNGRNGRAGQRYRKETAEMIEDGRYRDAMAREVKDVRRAAKEGSGDQTKYNKHMREMLEYAKETEQLPKK